MLNYCAIIHRKNSVWSVFCLCLLTPVHPAVSRLWDIECGACLRVLEGHEELVRCIRFDNKRIVSGAYDGSVLRPHSGFFVLWCCLGFELN